MGDAAHLNPASAKSAMELEWFVLLLCGCGLERSWMNISRWKEEDNWLAMARNDCVFLGNVNDGKQAKSTINIFFPSFFGVFYFFFLFFCRRSEMNKLKMQGARVWWRRERLNRKRKMNGWTMEAVFFFMYGRGASAEGKLLIRTTTEWRKHGFAGWSYTK